MASRGWRFLSRWCALAADRSRAALDRLFPLPLPDPTSGSTVVLARDGTPLRAFPDADGVWRYPVQIEDVSPLYLEALLTYEDRWFYQHPGVNPFALARAFGQWIVQRHARVRRLDADDAGRAHPRPARRTAPAASCDRCCARCSSKRICPSARSSRCTSIARRSAARSKASKPACGRTSASPRRSCRVRKRRCWPCCRRRRAVCVRIATRTPRASRATRCCGAWPSSARGRKAEVARRAHRIGRRARLQQPMRRGAAGRAPARRAPAQRAHHDDDRRRAAARARSARAAMPRAPARTHVGGAAGRRQRDAGSARLRRLGGVRRRGAARPCRHGARVAFARLDAETLSLRPGARRRPDRFREPAGRRAAIVRRLPARQFRHGFNGPVGAAEALRLSLNVPAVRPARRVGPARFAARLRQRGRRADACRAASRRICR